MTIEKPSETSTHEDATVGYWQSEANAHREIFERGRQAGYREGIEAASAAAWEYGIGCQRGPGCERCELVRWITADIRALLPDDTED